MDREKIIFIRDFAKELAELKEHELTKLSPRSDYFLFVSGCHTAYTYIVNFLNQVIADYE